MDFTELLNIAAQNQAAAQAEVAVKRYGTTSSAPKKHSKSNIRSEAVRKFLAKKKCEEQQKALTEQRKKEELLTLRFQKTGKKPKMMASRTKDKDFSQLKAGKVDEKTTAEVESPRERMSGNAFDISKNATASPRQPSQINYADLLKLASQKQQQTVKPTGAEVSGGRPMTKKEKAQQAEEHAKARRRLQRKTTAPSQPLTAKTNSSRVLQKKDDFRDGNRAPQQNKSRKVQGSDTANNSNQVLSQTSSVPSRHLPGVRNGCSENKQLLNKIKNRDIGNAQDQTRFASPVVRPQNSKSGARNPQIKGPGKISQERRNVLPKSVNLVQSVHAANKVIISESTKALAGMSLEGRKKVVSDNRPLSTKLQMIKKPCIPQVKTFSNSDSKGRESKQFHMNPYMEEPVQVLEQRNTQKKQMKRRVESDDEDDMSDFIDDDPCEGDVNYSKYIKEIFRCDRSKFVDYDDDDDIMETSYAEQMKEEKRSAKLGYLEDLEDIKMEQEEKKRKKMLKKKRP